MSTTSTDRTGRIGDVGIKAPCRVATTAAITLSGQQTIDGVAVVADDRVLVKNQASSVDNGIYVADTGDWSRAPDFDGSYDCANGTLIKVNSGTANSGFWYASGTDPIQIGTDAVTFVQASTVLAVISAFMQTMLDDADAAAARTTLGSTTVGDAVFIAATAAAGRTALAAAGTGLATASGLTQSTARLLGRTTAGTGAIEEITVGSGLSLAAGVLTGVAAASQAEMEAASSATVMATPSNTKYHPGVAKAWVSLNFPAGTPTINTSMNVSSLGDNGAGDFTVNFTTAFSSANYAVAGFAKGSGGRYVVCGSVSASPAAGSCRCESSRTSTETPADVDFVSVAFFGDQA